MSINYSKLKPYHVQQINNACSSVASTTMILNAMGRVFDISYLSQKILLEELRGFRSTRFWYTQTANGGGNRLSLDVFGKYLSRYFTECDLPCKVKMKQKKRTSLREFYQDVGMAEESNCHYLILSYDNHFSPLGQASESEMVVLNTDWDKAYGREYRYTKEKGEDVYGISDFFVNVMTSNSGYLVVEMY